MTNEQLENRLNYIETVINNILSALIKKADREQVRQLANLRQADIASLQTRVDALENQVQSLEGLHLI